MKRLIVFLGCIFSFCLGFSQSVTVTTHGSDTVKAAPTSRKKIVKVNSYRANSVQTGPVIRANNKDNQSGIKEEEEKSKTPN